MIYLKLFWIFFKIGAFTFGGGYAMLPLVQEEVIKNGFLTSEELINFVAISESTPGPFAVNISTFVGMKTSGIMGSIFSTLGVVLPSFIIILIIAIFFEKLKQNRYVNGMMNGIRPVALGLILTAVITIGKTVFFYDEIAIQTLNTVKFYVTVGIFIFMNILAFKNKSPILIICVSACLGIIFGYLLNI